MQHSTMKNKKPTCEICANCGKAFKENELRVSYDFEKFYCCPCDDKR